MCPWYLQRPDNLGLHEHLHVDVVAILCVVAEVNEYIGYDDSDRNYFEAMTGKEDCLDPYY